MSSPLIVETTLKCCGNQNKIVKKTYSIKNRQTVSHDNHNNLTKNMYTFKLYIVQEIN